MQARSANLGLRHDVNCECRTCSRTLHSYRGSRGSNLYSPRHTLSSLTNRLLQRKDLNIYIARVQSRALLSNQHKNVLRGAYRPGHCPGDTYDQRCQDENKINHICFRSAEANKS